MTALAMQQVAENDRHELDEFENIDCPAYVRPGLFDEPQIQDVLCRMEARARARAIDSIRRSRELYFEVCALHRQGVTYRQICRLLNIRHELSPRGREWDPDSLGRFVLRHRVLEGKMTRVEEYQPTVRRLFVLRGLQLSNKRVAEVLNREGHRTYQGLPWTEGSVIRFAYRHRQSVERQRSISLGRVLYN